MSVGMSTRTGKHTPIGIAAHVIVSPTGFIGVMKSHWNILVTGFCIEHGFDGIVFPRRVHIHPIVLLSIVGNRIVSIAHALPITAVSALECMEIKPCCLTPPLGRRIAATRMIGHQVVFVYRLDGCCQCFPHLWFDITLNVATHKPNDVRPVLIAVSQERTVFLGIVHTQLAGLYQSAPDAHHTDIDAVLGSHIDDIVHVVPIAIHTFTVDILEVPTIHIRHLSIYIIGRYPVNGLYLYDVIARLGTRLQVPLSLCPIQSFRQQPARFP